MKHTTFEDDVRRYGGGIPSYTKRLLKCYRKLQICHNPILKMIFRLRFKRLKEQHGIELYYGTRIGKGLYIGHPYNITINADVVIGNNCNIHKGVLIGQENRGNRKGSPTIGNRVWIGINAVIVGNIHIGDDVLIAPNSFVNCDVPAHSVVFGNPCILKFCENATEGYINNAVD